MKRTFLALALLVVAQLCPVSAAELRLGIIGLDTSHVPAFTDVINNPQNKAHVPGAKVVAAFKGGSPDIASSRDRVEGFTKTLVEKYGVKIYDSIEEMVKNVDAVLIESVDGRPHLAQAIPVIKAFQSGIVPVKPEETIEIFAFMEAADESKRRGGAEVTLAEVLKKAGK